MLVWPDNKKFIGSFFEGKMDGIGTLTLPNGEIQKGEWSKGKFLKNLDE